MCAWLYIVLKYFYTTYVITGVCVLVGGLTGAGAKITGAVGDVFAKLTFDEQFQDKRQQQKTKPPKLGSKLGGFAKVSPTHRVPTHSYMCVDVCGRN